MAAANFWSPLSVRQVKLRHLLHLAVPANEFVNLAALGTEARIDDYRYVMRNDPPRDSLHDFDWLPTRHGALVKTIPVHAPNELFDTSFRLFAVQSPFRMGKTAYAVRLLSEERYVDLRGNLEHFREKYQQILADHDHRFDPMASVRGTPYRRVARLHADYVQAQLADVERLLAQLDAIQSAPEPERQVGSSGPPDDDDGHHMKEEKT